MPEALGHGAELPPQVGVAVGEQLVPGGQGFVDAGVGDIVHLPPGHGSLDVGVGEQATPLNPHVGVGNDDGHGFAAVPPVHVGNGVVVAQSAPFTPHVTEGDTDTLAVTDRPVPEALGHGAELIPHVMEGVADTLAVAVKRSVDESVGQGNPLVPQLDDAEGDPVDDCDDDGEDEDVGQAMPLMPHVVDGVGVLENDGQLHVGHPVRVGEGVCDGVTVGVTVCDPVRLFVGERVGVMDAEGVLALAEAEAGGSETGGGSEPGPRRRAAPLLLVQPVMSATRPVDEPSRATE